VRSMFEHRGDKLASPGIGTLPPEWLDLPLLHSALRRATQDDARDQASLRYGDPAGDLRLRSALTQRLADLGIAADAAQIVTSAGATAALDLVAHVLLAPGDSVLVDEPGWPVEFARLALMGVKCIPLPRATDGSGGPDRVAMRRLLEQHPGIDKPRAYITVSVLHNPTGSSITLAAAHEVLKIAEAHDLTIVEDDSYAWLAPKDAPRLSTLDQLQRTVHVGGFSKILTPAWRVGFLAAAPALVERAIDRKLLTTLGAPGLMERALPSRWNRAPCGVMPSASASAWPPRAPAPCAWRKTQALPSPRRRRACSAGWTPGSIPSCWPRTCTTRAGC
jgi:DNA-binding transcriptional MocR family regulator